MCARENALMPEVLWYYARDDQQFGPVTAAELKQMADAGDLSPDDLLWREGMESWTTAINLRGLFAEKPLPDETKRAPAPQAARTLPGPIPRRTPNIFALANLVYTTQMILWGICVLMVLAGVILFTRAFLVAKELDQEMSAAVTYGTLFVGAYVLARAGEKLSKLLLEHTRRRQD